MEIHNELQKEVVIKNRLIERVIGPFDEKIFEKLKELLNEERTGRKVVCVNSLTLSEVKYDTVILNAGAIIICHSTAQDDIEEIKSFFEEKKLKLCNWYVERDLRSKDKVALHISFTDVFEKMNKSEFEQLINSL